MNEDTKGKIFIIGLAVIAGFVYLQSQNIKHTSKFLTSKTATQLVKSSENVLTQKETIKATEKTIEKVAEKVIKKINPKNWLFKV